MSDVERSQVITFKGNPMTLIGAEVKVGDSAPDFNVVANDLSPVNLATSKGKTRLISVVPSLDTPVCEMQTKRFNEEAAKLPDNVITYTVSLDLPFAQKRWCAAVNAENVQTVSDYQDRSFAKAYGVLIKELKLLTRAIFIIGADDKVQYVEYVKEVTDQPDYDAALKALSASVQA